MNANISNIEISFSVYQDKRFFLSPFIDPELKTHLILIIGESILEKVQYTKLDACRTQRI